MRVFFIILPTVTWSLLLKPDITNLGKIIYFLIDFSKIIGKFKLCKVISFHNFWYGNIFYYQIMVRIEDISLDANNHSSLAGELCNNTFYYYLSKKYEKSDEYFKINFKHILWHIYLINDFEDRFVSLKRNLKKLNRIESDFNHFLSIISSTSYTIFTYPLCIHNRIAYV